MENIIKVGQAGIINFNVWCEDNEGYISRIGVAEVKLPVVDNERELNFTLELRLGGVVPVGVTENPINKKEIHHIELRAAVQEKDPATDKIIVRAINHLFNVEPISIDDNTEKYAVEYWKSFIDGKKVEDILYTELGRELNEFNGANNTGGNITAQKMVYKNGQAHFVPRNAELKEKWQQTLEHFGEIEGARMAYHSTPACKMIKKGYCH